MAGKSYTRPFWMKKHTLLKILGLTRSEWNGVVCHGAQDFVVSVYEVPGVKYNRRKQSYKIVDRAALDAVIADYKKAQVVRALDEGVAAEWSLRKLLDAAGFTMRVIAQMNRSSPLDRLKEKKP
jgi:hypothetical protein